MSFVNSAIKQCNFALINYHTFAGMLEIAVISWCTYCQSLIRVSLVKNATRSRMSAWVQQNSLQSDQHYSTSVNFLLKHPLFLQTLFLLY